MAGSGCWGGAGRPLSRVPFAPLTRGWARPSRTRSRRKQRGPSRAAQRAQRSDDGRSHLRPISGLSTRLQNHGARRCLTFAASRLCARTMGNRLGQGDGQDRVRGEAVPYAVDGRNEAAVAAPPRSMREPEGRREPRFTGTDRDLPPVSRPKAAEGRVQGPVNATSRRKRPQERREVRFSASELEFPPLSPGAPRRRTEAARRQTRSGWRSPEADA